MVDYLNKSGKVNVEIEILEYYVIEARPEYRDVNIQYIVMDARNERSRKLFAELSGKGRREYLLARMESYHRMMDRQEPCVKAYKTMLEAAEFICETQKTFLVTMVRKQQLTGDILEHREQFC